MALSIEPNKNNPNPPRQKVIKPQPFNVEVIESLTPIILALIGGAIGIAVLFTSASEAGFGLASTAIAGAAGLAQPYKNQNRKEE